MTPLALKTTLATRLGSEAFSFRQKPVPRTVPTGIEQVDFLTGGLPRGALTEISGPASSGRTTLMHSVLRETTNRGEFCALVDASDAFDPASASASGVHLPKLLWVRCAAHKKNALAVTDLLLQNGGWGVVVLDLTDVEPREVRRIPLHTWYRYRRAVENTPTVFLLVGQEPCAGSCSALSLETGKQNSLWCGTLLQGADFQAALRKPPRGYGSFACEAILKQQWKAVCTPVSF
jgi:hypothetical protein